MLAIKSCLIGAGIGVALTMVTLDICGRLLGQRIAMGASPWLLEPFRGNPVPQLPQTSDKLPPPVLPIQTSAIHDRWTIYSLTGKPTALGDLKGRIVFLNFWSTSCVPCIAEMPGIEKLQDSLRNDPVTFLAITEDDERLVRKFLEKVPSRLPIYLARTAHPYDLGPNAFPRTIILDLNGKVAFSQVGAVNWDIEDARIYIRTLGGR